MKTGQMSLPQESLSVEASPRLQGIVRLHLSSFRSYGSLSLDLSPQPVVLVGANGAGKTNILEAISYLSPGRGLRKASLSEVQRLGSLSPWAVSVRLDDGLMTTPMGTGLDSRGGSRERRIAQVAGERLKTLAQLSEYVSIHWLTPQMDRIFLDGSAQRRSFLDRFVMGLDGLHADRLHRYEHILRERSILLKEGGYDPLWVRQLEEKMASHSVAIEMTRLDVITLLNEALARHISAFPQAHLTLKSGVVDVKSPLRPALVYEEQLQHKLEESRVKDAHVGGASVGAHRSDLEVLHVGKNMPADLCSTGEQKALLLSMIIAFSRVQSLHPQGVPLLLLDEVVAHLDERRRSALFEEIIGLKIQAWLTGTDTAVFDGMKDYAQFFQVNEAQLQPVD